MVSTEFKFFHLRRPEIQNRRLKWWDGWLFITRRENDSGHTEWKALHISNERLCSPVSRADMSAPMHSYVCHTQMLQTYGCLSVVKSMLQFEIKYVYHSHIYIKVIHKNNYRRNTKYVPLADIFWVNWIESMAAVTLAPCVARSPAIMVLTMCKKCLWYFSMEKWYNMTISIIYQG